MTKKRPAVLKSRTCSLCDRTFPPHLVIAAFRASRLIDYSRCLKCRETRKHSKPPAVRKMEATAKYHRNRRDPTLTVGEFIVRYNWVILEMAEETIAASHEPCADCEGPIDDLRQVEWDVADPAHPPYRWNMRPICAGCNRAKGKLSRAAYLMRLEVFKWWEANPPDHEQRSLFHDDE